MIYLKLHDRMGNVMFMLAAALFISDDVSVYTDNEKDEQYVKQLLDNFNISINIIKKNDIPQCDLCNFSLSPIVYKPIDYRKGEEIRLDGYFQSYKYFDIQFARRLFKPPEFIVRKIEVQYGEMLNLGETVCVHVRRGDYMLLPERFAFVGLRYIKTAMKHFASDTLFVFTSDDIEWCKKHFRGDNIYYSEGNSPLFDMFLATYCTHNIISNSTFSWWGAYLNPNPSKKVICPSRWYGPVLAQEANEKESDLIPPEWIKEKCYWDDVASFCRAYYLYAKVNWRKWLHLSNTK